MQHYKPQLLKWLAAQATTIDTIIHNAAQLFYEKHKSLSNFGFDLSESQKESYYLSQNKDLCYDRITTPFVYSLWYQGRRINSFLPYFIEAILNAKQEPINLFDLGAGTGAVQMVIGLLYAGLDDISGGKYILPEIKIINVDSSPFMLQYHKQYLWQEFIKHYPKTTAIQAEYNTNSWNNAAASNTSNTWITASYLFDISDSMKEVANDFNELVGQYKPSKLLLTTSNQPKKISLLDATASTLAPLGYKVDYCPYTSIIAGNFQKVNSFRRTLATQYAGQGLKYKAYWSENKIYGKILSSNGLKGTPLSMIQMYNPPVGDRINIGLSKEQLDASKLTEGPSKIIGSAGSGKTVVITEKIKKIAEKANYNPKLKILVTTFNKALSSRISEWIENLLDANRIEKEVDSGAYYFHFEEGRFNIKVMHFDILPTRLGKIPLGNLKAPSDWHEKQLTEIATTYMEANPDLSEAVTRYLTGEYLFEEYRRVFYGKNVKSWDMYQQAEIVDEDSETIIRLRAGRGHRLQTHQRKAIYDCIRNYMKYTHENKSYCFEDLRRKFLAKLKSDNHSIEKLDYLIVDEFQDCTRSDFKIFYALLKDPNNLTITGDLAQSIRLGKSATSDLRAVKSTAKSGLLKNFESFPLSVSYRLPFRVSQSIEKISQHISMRWEAENKEESKNLLQIKPVKKSPPGARPIVVYGKDEMEIAQKIKEIIAKYKCYNLNKFTVLENDKPFAQALWGVNLEGRRDSILSLKGMENALIIWSSRKAIGDSKEVYEFLYTIFTRTTSILILAIFDTLLDEYREPLQLLNKELLIFWDEESVSKFKELTQVVQEAPQILQSRKPTESYGQNYGEYAGTYAQEVAGYSDDVINDAFDGEPDAYWNID